MTNEWEFDCNTPRKLIKTLEQCQFNVFLIINEDQYEEKIDALNFPEIVQSPLDIPKMVV